MVMIRHHRPEGGPVIMECPFFDELIKFRNEAGRLPENLEAHALWHYYCLAASNYERAKKNLVDESELSLSFTQEQARVLFQSIANVHGVKPSDMSHYWDCIDQQRMALKSDEVLPERFKFKYWGH